MHWPVDQLFKKTYSLLRVNLHKIAQPLNVIQPYEINPDWELLKAEEQLTEEFSIHSSCIDL